MFERAMCSFPVMIGITWVVDLIDRKIYQQKVAIIK